MVFVRGVRSLVDSFAATSPRALIGCRRHRRLRDGVRALSRSTMNTIWQTDFVTYSLVAATFIGSPFVLMTRGHVNVDVLPHYVEPAPRAGGLRCSHPRLSLAFCVMMRGAHVHSSGRKPGTTSGSPTPCGARGCGFRMPRCRSAWACLTLAMRRRLAGTWSTGREPPFGIRKERHA